MSDGNGGAKYTYEAFVKAWQGSTGVEEVAEKLGVSRNSVENTRTKLVKAGVKLKSMLNAPRRGEPDVEALNKLIEAP